MVLNIFIHSQAPLVYTQMLVEDSAGFENAVFLAKWLAGAHGWSTHHPPFSGLVYIDLRALQRPPLCYRVDSKGIKMDILITSSYIITTNSMATLYCPALS